MQDSQLYIKISYFYKKNKLINKKAIYSNTTYQQFVKKIRKELSLSYDKYYHLYYQQQNCKITISNQEHFTIFLNHQSSNGLMLFLEPTSVEDKHFLSIEKVQQKELSLEQINTNLKQTIQTTRNLLHDDLNQWKKQMQLKVQRAYESTFNNFIIKLKGIRQNKAIHKKISCNKCALKKDIIGIRYQCALCNYNLCQLCIMKNQYQHPKNHPFIRIMDQSQQLSHKDNKIGVIQNKRQEKKLQRKKESQNKQEKSVFKQENKKKQFGQQQNLIKDYNDKLQKLMDICVINKSKAQQFIKKYPTKTIQQLSNQYFIDYI